MKKKANALMLDELLRAHYKPLNAFTHKKFDTTDIRGLPFSDKKGKVIWRRDAIKKVKNENRVTKSFTKEWSVVSTADRMGVAIKPKGRIASRYEVCVVLRDNVLHINLYEDCAVFPLFEITKRVDLYDTVDKIEVAEGE